MTKPLQQPGGRRLGGALGCLLAIMLASGGHWYVLQSIAWTRMFVHYIQQDPLPVAVAKTFNGKNPCPLCVEIRQGQRQEQSQGAKQPWVKLDKLPELLCDARPVTVPMVPVLVTEAPVGSMAFFYDFSESPPTPPPRG